MNQNDKQVKELRGRFLKKLEESEPDVFHPFDVNRVKTDDKYLCRFLLHNDGNEETAFNMLWETCEWRKKFGVNDITESNVNQTILESGSVFPYGKDKDGKTMLVFKSKKHVKGAHPFEDLKRCLVYWMERVERQENGEMISLFFDMDGAVFVNMDMDYTTYLISLFKSYYPHFLNYIIIFEMAWVLNALFKVIKSWLPPKAIEKMKFVNKSSVKDFVDPDYCLKSWGGKDNFVFQFVPEEKKTPTSPVTNGEDHRKKVHFAEGSFKKEHNESGFEDSPTSGAQSAPPTSTSSSLNVSPSDIMFFAQDGNEVTSSILLKNEDSKLVSYKIKTTSPEKFRVRPSAGILHPSGSATINVVLLPGYLMQSLQRDKFLIMSIQLDQTNVSPGEINDLWKQVNEKDIRQHRLRCAVPQTSTSEHNVKNGSAFNFQSAEDPKMMAKLCAEVNKLNLYMGSLREDIKSVREQQWMIIISLLVFFCSMSFFLYWGKPSFL